MASRAGLRAQATEARLCAATTMAAIRVVDEEISLAAVNDGHAYAQAEATGRLAAAVRIARTLPIADPVD